MDDRERRFLEGLKELVTRGRQQGGVLQSHQMEEAFAGLDLTKDQEKLVADYLAQNHIGMEVPLPEEERITPEEGAALKLYEESLEGLILPEESVRDALRLAAMAGEKDAKEQVVLWMLGKVPELARLYAGQGVFAEDLIGAGNEALLRGVELLAPLEKPSEVDPFLISRIMDAMEDLIAQNLDEAALDAQAEETANLVAEKAHELAGLLGRKVSVRELADEGELDEETIREAMDLTGGKIEDLSE